MASKGTSKGDADKGNGRATPSTERILLDAAIALRAKLARGDHDDLLPRASRIVEAVWLAAHRGDTKELGEPNGWASGYLNSRTDDERFWSGEVLTRSEKIEQLLDRAKFRLQGLRKAREIQGDEEKLSTWRAERGARGYRLANEATLAKFMVSDAHRAGLFLPWEAARANQAEMKLKERLMETDPDAIGLVRMTLAAFGMDSKTIDRWVEFLRKQKAMGSKGRARQAPRRPES